MGRRWGKTTMAGILALEAANAGAAVAWVAPTYSNSRPLWRFVEAAAVQSPRVKVRRSEREVVMPSLGSIRVYTADNSVGMRGEAFDIAILDEAPQYAPDVWSDVIMPTLADRDGRAFLIGTPKGRNWFYLEWLRAGQDGAAFRAPSSDNPLPAIRRAAELVRTRVSDRTYRQEWLAEFISDGSFFVNVEACATAQPAEPQDGHAYVIGADWARSSGGDATVFAVMDAGERRMVAMQRMTGAAFDVQLARLRSLHQAYNRAHIIAEYNAMGGPLVERLQAEGLPVTSFVTTAASKHSIMTALELAFDGKAITVLADPVLIGELSAYEKHDRAGLPGYSAPEGMHDDTVIALALAWHGIGQEITQTENPFYD
jgi:hypothetical protein